MSIAVLATRATVDAAWEEYRLLAAAVLDDHTLLTDRAHQEAMVRAWQDWRDLFLRWDSSR